MLTMVERENFLRTRLGIPLAPIEDFCQRWQISELALFGSVLRDDFSANSDIDLLVTYGAGRRFGFRDFLAMRDELESLLGREPDLVEKDLLENPYLRSEILNTAMVIYGIE